MGANHFDRAKQIHGGLPPGIDLISATDFDEWLLDIRVLDKNPLYLDQVYRLKFRFGSSYPIGTNNPCSRALHNASMMCDQRLTLLFCLFCTEPPEVVFVKLPDRPIPIHPHVYSNGIICLDLLGQKGWSPVQNVESVCMSIQSMLTGNSKNERPPGDEEFVRGNRLRPKDIDFYYHDNTV